EFENLDQVGFAERHEQDDFIYAIQELRIERALDLAPHQVFDFFRNHLVFRRLEAQTLALHQVPRADVRRHDDDGVLEVDGVAQSVGQLAVFKNLQQNVEDIGVRLLNFVEQNDRI